MGDRVPGTMSASWVQLGLKLSLQETVTHSGWECRVCEKTAQGQILAPLLKLKKVLRVTYLEPG